MTHTTSPRARQTDCLAFFNFLLIHSTALECKRVHVCICVLERNPQGLKQGDPVPLGINTPLYIGCYQDDGFVSFCCHFFFVLFFISPWVVIEMTDRVMLSSI
jgi:hypothetical protein